MRDAATVPTPDLKVLDVQATCVLLVPVALDGAKQVVAMTQTPDGSTVDWPKVQKTYEDLMFIRQVGAPEMRDDIDQQTALLAQLLSIKQTGANMAIEVNEFRASGLRIGARCAQYAS